MNRPLASIIMPAFNCGKYIGEAISAVLDQTFKDYELIIINDGSTDNTRDVIISFVDPRIVFFENKKNLGIVDTLNNGLSFAKGKYIIRTDADDVALKDMVESLVEFMETHPDYVVCGGNMRLIGGEKIFRYPAENEELKIYTLNACPFSHSTVIFRNDVLKVNNLKYDGTVKDGEDHALWSDLLLYGKFKNLTKVTLLYRESTSQITSQKSYSKNYVDARAKIFTKHAVKYFGLVGAQIDMYVKFISSGKIDTIEELSNMGELFLRLLKTNNLKLLFDPYNLKRFLFIKWHWLCLRTEFKGVNVLLVYYKYSLLSYNIPRARLFGIDLLFRLRKYI